MNHRGFHWFDKHQNAANKATAPASELHANKRSAETRWSASAPPMSGENNAQNGATAKAMATHSPSPSARRMFVSAGYQNPGVMPWKKNTTHSQVNVRRAPGLTS